MTRTTWIRTWICVWAMVGCARGVSEPAARVEEPATAVGRSEPSVSLDDRRLLQRLTDEAAKLIDSGKTVKGATLIAQLSASRCRLSLAAAGRVSLSAEDVYAKAKSSVLVVAGIYKCTKCQQWHAATASGFVISANGAAVTNYHVVEHPDRETLVAMTADGRVLPVKSVLAASKADDVAILQLEGSRLEPMALGGRAAVGSRVQVISHPDSRFFMLTDGLVSRYHNAARDNAQSARMDITADYAKGSSGAPVLNSRGAAVGMVSSTFSIYYNEKDGQKQNLQMVVKECIPAASILRLIEQ